MTLLAQGTAIESSLIDGSPHFMLTAIDALGQKTFYGDFDNNGLVRNGETFLSGLICHDVNECGRLCNTSDEAVDKDDLELKFFRFDPIYRVEPSISQFQRSAMERRVKRESSR